ncbi:hypothetical protein SGLAM104S_06616 [Streptomyces glaucescens]
MKSGLYAFAGASATATAAAWAKRFDAPITKVSKRYLGLSRAVGSPGPVAGAGCAASGPGAPLAEGPAPPGPRCAGPPDGGSGMSRRAPCWS